MSSLLLSLAAVLALGQNAQPQPAPAPAVTKSKAGVDEKAPASTVISVPVRTFVVSGDRVELSDDQGFAWVQSSDATGGPLKMLDMLGPRRYIGVQLVTLTPELRRHFGVPEDRGVMVSKVLDETPAARAGVEVGDVLITADDAAIVTAGDVTRVLVDKEPGEEVRIDLWRDGALMGLDVAFEEREAAVLQIGPQHLPHTALLHDRGEIPADAQALADKTITFRAVRQEELDDAMSALDDYFQSEEWQQRLRQLKNLDLDEVQQRMKTLERRLQELERELAEKRR